MDSIKSMMPSDHDYPSLDNQPAHAHGTRFGPNRVAADMKGNGVFDFLGDI